MQPMNYAIDVASPIEAAVSGLKFGAGLAELQQARADREMKLRQQEFALQQQQAMQQAAAQLRQKVAQGAATVEDFTGLAQMLPKDQAEIVLKSWDAMSKDQQTNELSFGTRVLSALGSPDPTIGVRLLRERAEAEYNAGRRDRSRAYEDYAKLAELDPEGATVVISPLIARLPGGKEALEGYVRLQEERRVAKAAPLKIRADTADVIIKEAQAKFAPDKFGAELQLTENQIEQSRAARRAQDAAARASEADAARKQAEADQIAAGIIPIDKRPEAESKFRKEYSDQTKGYQEVKAAFGRVLASQETAAGDLALIFNYMKMLDPGSVVREGEFATAQNAAGVPDRIANLYNNLVRGERLNKDQRKMFAKQAEGLYNQSRTQEAQVRQGIERIAKGYGLNTANIFYTPTEEAPAAPAAPVAQTPGARGRDIGGGFRVILD